MSIALGLFIGVGPFWGLQIILTLGIAHLTKLNKAIAVVAANISIPPMIPLILYASYKIGFLFMGLELDLNLEDGLSLDQVHQQFLQYVIGSLSLGVILASIGGPVSLLLLRLFRKPSDQIEINSENTKKTSL